MKPTFETLEERPALGLRRRVRVVEIGDRIGEMMPVLMAVAGPHAAGPPLARWHGWEGDRGEMELAVPVRAPTEGRGEVAATTLPGGRAVVFWHVGPYDGLRAACEALTAWMGEHEVVGRDAPWEEYVDDPRTTPTEELRTRIVWPVA